MMNTRPQFGPEFVPWFAILIMAIVFIVAYVISASVGYSKDYNVYDRHHKYQGFYRVQQNGSVDWYNKHQQFTEKWTPRYNGYNRYTKHFMYRGQIQSKGIKK